MRDSQLYSGTAGAARRATAAIVLWTSVSAGAAVIEEVVVTAQKRESTLQDVPVAITALTASELNAINFSDSSSLATFVPNLQIDSPWGYTNPGIFLRGIGNGDVNAVAASKVGVYQDQVYQGLLVGQNFQLFDLERVEVLKGPQGTLYGKNTTGGALNVSSRRPDGTRNGYLQTDIGDYDYMSFEGAFGLPINDSWSVRVAGVFNQRDGWARNIVDGRDLDDVDNYAARAMLRYQGERLDALLRLTRGRNRTTFRQGQPDTDGSPFGGATVGGFVNNLPDESVMTTDLDTFMDVDQDGIALIWDYDFDAFTLTSVTTYDEGDLRALQDADHSPDSIINIGWRTNSHQVAQELRIANDAAARFDYLFGFFFVDEQIEDGTGSDFRIFADALPALGLPVLDVKQDMEQSAQQYALFADFNFALNEQWSLNGGLRYTIDQKKFFTVAALIGLNNVPLPPGAAFTVPLTSFDEEWTALSGHVGMEWRPADDILLYAGFSRGFNGGGFNGGAIVDPGEAVAFDPEFLNAWEVGAKTTWFDRRLTVNVSGFYYDYSDLQVQVITTSPFSNNFIQIIENASDAEIYGSEIEFVAVPTDYLRISGALGLLHSEFVNFQSIVGDASGNKLPEAPEIDFSGIVHYERPFRFGNWFVRGEFSYTSERFYNSAENPKVSSGGGNEQVNAKVGWISQDESWKVTLWVNNVTDTQYVARALDLADGFGFVSNWFSDPRTYGAQVAYHFD
ncbi:MAG: TonB-dependent receptor [Gammaproteobacteria bacterium]|nr:TonB-dependent receptor [Gammaproteobacteria bacterium]